MGSGIWSWEPGSAQLSFSRPLQPLWLLVQACGHSVSNFPPAQHLTRVSQTSPFGCTVAATVFQFLFLSKSFSGIAKDTDNMLRSREDAVLLIAVTCFPLCPHFCLALCPVELSQSHPFSFYSESSTG